MYQGELRKRVSEHSQRVIQNNECERRLLDSRMFVMNKEHLRQLRNYDIEVLQLKQEIKMFNNAKREYGSGPGDKNKLRNRPSSVELIRQVPNKMRSKTIVHAARDADDRPKRKATLPQLEPTRDRYDSKTEQASSDAAQNAESNRQRTSTNDNRELVRRDRCSSLLDPSVGTNQNHLPELPKHLQRYDHRRRPTDEFRMNGTFSSHGSNAMQLSMVHSVAWLSFRERQTVMTSIYSNDDEDDDNDASGDLDARKEYGDGDASNKPTLKTTDNSKNTSKLISASDSAVYSNFHTGMYDVDVDEDETGNLPAYHSQYLTYYSLNRGHAPEAKKTENDLLDMMTRSSRIRFGQGRHIAARMERRRLLRSWNARSLPTSQNMDTE